jgi:hypothetical protein
VFHGVQSEKKADFGGLKRVHSQTRGLAGEQPEYRESHFLKIVPDRFSFGAKMKTPRFFTAVKQRAPNRRWTSLGNTLLGARHQECAAKSSFGLD